MKLGVVRDGKPATTTREQDAPTTFKTIVLKIDVVCITIDRKISYTNFTKNATDVSVEAEFPRTLQQSLNHKN
uniref:Uncharacterized protein n=1 Tax=[Tolypothrix] sp. PCC 7415 TaxID=373957 RepID=A0A2P0ZG85_9CYAN|nr:hypothetical protein [[Tolypothrix] sp. PCC 7415]